MNGVVLIFGIPLSGGRSGRKNPSSRWANHSENFMCFMVVCSRAVCENNKEHRVTISTDRMMEPIFTIFRSWPGKSNSATGVVLAWPLYKTRT